MEEADACDIDDNEMAAATLKISDSSIKVENEAVEAGSHQISSHNITSEEESSKEEFDLPLNLQH